MVIGASAGAAVTTGSNNIMIGYNVASTTTTGNNNIYIDVMVCILQMKATPFVLRVHKQRYSYRALVELRSQ